MSFLRVDENQIPSFMNDSKKRQSCPAQISELSHRSFGQSSQILGDSTNMRRSFVENTMKNSFLSEKKLSVSSHFSEKEQGKSEIRLSRNNDKLDESQLKKSSISKQDYSIIEEDCLSQKSGILSKESSVSKRLSNSSIKEELSASSQKSEQALSEQLSQNSQLQQNKSSGSTLKKILIIVFISLACFLAVASAKFFILKAQGQTSLLSSNEEIFAKNKYFDELTNEKQQLLEEQNQIQVQKDVNLEIQEVELESLPQDQGQLDSESKQNVYNNKYSDQGTPQLSMPKQEMLIQEESELFFSNLVKVVQAERRIPYSQFEEYLVDRCTPAILDKVKERIQILVDESVSIKEELDILTGTRFFVSLEKN